MTSFLLLLVFNSAPPCKAEPPPLLESCFTFAPNKPETPLLFLWKPFTCVTLAEAINHYVDLGEEAAIKELEFLVSGLMPEFDGGFTRKERIAWVCRVLFQPIGADPLRPPAYGVLRLPYISMPLTTWRLFPVAGSGASHFVLSEGYLIGGEPEDPKAYLAYCRANGKFRTERVPIPTRNQALNDLKQLRQSAAWRAIKWSGGNEYGSYMFSEDWTWRFGLDHRFERPGMPSGGLLA